jgi:hypothetical protein
VENRASGARRWTFVVALIVGLGLAAAPVAFQMFTRAPKGGDMIDAFRPYMTNAKITRFQRDMRNIDAAMREARAQMLPALSDKAQLDRAAVDSQFASYAALDKQWKAINADMSDMLRTMHRDLGDFAAVDALPPFKLFPWFFVLPGLMVAGFAGWGLVRSRRRDAPAARSTRAPAVALIVLGLAIVAAPVMFQMFTRAPKGGHMINDFRPLMTTTKVQRIQGYFLVIGAGEGTIRNQMLPVLVKNGSTPAGLAAQLPALTRFSHDWPSTSNQMAPMIGAMSDNVDNYLAVDAMPPFPLFPWFFVVPGLLVAACGVIARRGSRAEPVQV